MFRYYNANPKGKKVEDCTIRAISVAEGISWDEAYDELSASARDLGLMMSSVEAVEEYLDNKYKRVPVYVETVGEFIDAHPYGTYLITMKDHITAVKNARNFDTFDPSDREIWSAWRVR